MQEITTRQEALEVGINLAIEAYIKTLPFIVEHDASHEWFARLGDALETLNDVIGTASDVG